METLNSFNGGMFKDLSHVSQPKGTYIELRNGIRSVDGTPFNERGTTSLIDIKSGYSIVALKELDDELIVLSTNGVLSEVGVMDSGGLYTTYINNSVFKFSKDRLVSCITKKNYRGNRLIYFTDGVEPVRKLNLDKLPTNEIDKRTKLFLDYKVPSIGVSEVLETGSIPTGIYQFSVRLVNEDRNKTAFSFITSPCPIVNDSKSQGSKQYDGAPPQTTSGKSIKLKISNIDTTYKYVEISVSTFIGTENALKVSLLPLQPIQGRPEFEYVFSSLTQLQAEIVLNELLQEYAHYDSAEHILQKDNHLLLANLKTTLESNDFQEVANKMVGYYTIETLSSPDNVSIVSYTDSRDSVDNGQSTTLIKDYNDELTAQSKVGYMRGEAYSFALVPIFKGKKFGNAYHIPAQAINFTREEAGSFDYNNLADVQADVQTKRLGARMSTLRYPEEQGYPSTLIRHHLMPTQFQEPIIDSVGNIRALGVEFTPPVFSAEQLKVLEGYVIVRRHRSDDNKTILSQGIGQVLMKTGDKGQYVTVSPNVGVFPYCNDNTLNAGELPNNIAFYSPESVILESDLSSATSIEAVSIMKGTHYLVKPGISHTDGRGTKHWHSFLDYTTHIGDINNSVDVESGSIQYVPKDTGNDDYYMGNDSTKYSLKENTGYLTLKTTSKLPRPNTLLNGKPEFYFEEVSNRTDKVWLHKGQSSAYDQEKGDTTRYLFNIKSKRPAQYGEIYEGHYMYVNHRLFSSGETGNIKCYGGDTFIGKFGVISSTCEINGSTIDKPGIHFRTLNYFHCESTINVNYRHYITGLESEDNLTTVPYFPKVRKLWTKDNTGLLQLYPSLGHSRGYNRQYSFVNTTRPFFPKTLDQVEVSDFSNRVIYSDTAVEGEQFDSYSSFLLNNYHDIPRDKGGITDLFDFRGSLYIHTTDSLFKALFNEQTTQATSSGMVYLGNGGLFPVPSKEILTIDGGYAGSQNKWGSVNTPFGRFFVDQKRHAVFLLNEFPEDISVGMSLYMFNNLEPGNLMSVYDRENKRWILSTPTFTISFSPLLKSWTGFHDYTGNIMLASEKGLLITSKDSNKLYSLNTGDHGKYFEEDVKPFSIEFSVNEGVDTTKVFDNLILYSNAESPSGVKLPYEIFNKIQFYNDIQNSGELDVVVPKTFMEEFEDLQHSEIFLKKKGKEFRLSIPFDMVLDVDKSIFDITNLATDTAYRPRLSDKYLVVRCSYDNFANNTLQLNAVKTSFRILSR